MKTNPTSTKKSVRFHCTVFVTCPMVSQMQGSSGYTWRNTAQEAVKTKAKTDWRFFELEDFVTIIQSVHLYYLKGNRHCIELQIFLYCKLYLRKVFCTALLSICKSSYYPLEGNYSSLKYLYTVHHFKIADI